MTINPFFSKRNGCNLGFVSLTRDYMFVNHLDASYFRLIPQGVYAPSEPLLHQIIDDEGWPNSPLARNKNFGGGFWLPDTSKFGGNANDWTIYWEGEATCDFVGGGSWVIDTDINHTVSVSSPFGSTRFSNQGASSNSTVPALVRCHNVGLTLTDIYNIFLNTDPGATGNYVRNFKLYRTSDAPYVSTDPLFTGTEERYRRPNKQAFVDAMPGHIRFLTWANSSSSPAMRFTERSLPNFSNARIPPLYGESTGVANALVVAAVTGTPTSMQHGECCTTRIGTGIVSRGGVPTAISNAASGVVTAVGHNMLVGDRIIHDLRFGTPTHKLHNFPCTITAVANTGPISLGTNAFTTTLGSSTVTVAKVAHGFPNGAYVTIAGATSFNGVDPNGSYFVGVTSGVPDSFTISVGTAATSAGTGGGAFATESHNTGYTINVNTTTFGSYANTNPARDYSVIYTDLQVGSGSDRTAYPVIFQDTTQGAYYGSFMILAQDYKTFYFDKTVSAMSDGAGNPIMGAWFYNGAGNPFFQDGGGQPLEYCVQLINEINALAIEQGEPRRVHMWLNMPYACNVNGMDPDTDATNEYCVNAMGVVINGHGAFPGLLHGAKCAFEFANETWNFGGVFFGAGYLPFKGLFRWAGLSPGPGDSTSMHVLKSTLIMRQGKAAYGADAFCAILAGQYGAGWGGIGFGTGVNGSRLAGGPFYDNDVLNTWHTRPMDNHDGFCIAPYIDPGTPYLDATGPGSWQDDVELYTGTGAHAGSPDQTQALANFVQNVWHDAGVGAAVDDAVSLTATIAAGISPMILCNYEGGPDWPTIIGSALTGSKSITTTAQQTFMLATYNCTQYATAQVYAFTQFCANANFRNPSVLSWVGRPLENQRWCYTAPDTYGATFVEGDGLRTNPTWAAMAARNISPTIDRFFVPLHIHAQN